MVQEEAFWGLKAMLCSHAYLCNPTSNSDVLPEGVHVRPSSHSLRSLR